MLSESHNAIGKALRHAGAENLIDLNAIGQSFRPSNSHGARIEFRMDPGAFDDLVKDVRENIGDDKTGHSVYRAGLTGSCNALTWAAVVK